MDVLATARELGLFADGVADLVGGIEEQVVLAALADLAAQREQDQDLFAEAALRVQLARSAGVERVAADSIFARNGTDRLEQFRYRSEMCEMFTDLAIDLGVRSAATSESAIAG
jgi:hypothetical protein